MAITWTKEWMASDDGTIVSGLDLKNIQDDITSGSTGDATSLWAVPIVQPTAADDGKVLYYNHASPEFSYLTASSVVIPTGVILLWSGAISAIPAGWVLCDGTNSTPNLTDRFVIHADADSGGTNNVGDTGGVSSVTLTAAQSGLPAHSDHGITWGMETGAGTTYLGSEDGPQGTANASASNGITANSAQNASASHTNRDKYYALAYIMKT